jgi:general secretion pathway protein J
MQPGTRLSYRHHRQHGFTLLELLIASIVFAIMSIMAYSGLDNILTSHEIAQQSLTRLREIQQSVMIMNRDFSQIVRRPIRDEFGNAQPHLKTDEGTDLLIEFTRGGRANPAGLLRSSLQRVAYRTEENRLIRLSWNLLDRAQEAEPRETVLLEGLTEVNIRYLDESANWHDQWPPLNTEVSENLAKYPSPVGIEVVLNLEDWGEIRRLYALQ